MKLPKISKIAVVLAAIAAIPMAANAASITIDSVQQRWPWNNKVDITYTVSGGQDVAAGVYARIEFTANIAGTEYLIDGVHDVGASASDGTHTVMYAYTYEGDRKDLRKQIRRGPTEILPLTESFN